MSRTNQTAINIMTNTGGFLIPLSVNFIVTPILLRFIGEEGYGLQSLALVISGYLAFMDLGIDIPITKLLAEDHAKADHFSANQLLNTTLFLYLFIGLFGFFVIMFSRNFLTHAVFSVPVHQINDASIVFLLAGVGFALNMFGSWGRASLNGIQRYDINNVIRISTMVAASVIGLFAVYIGYGLVGFVAVRVISYGVSALLLFYSTQRLLPYFKIKLQISIDVLQRVKSYVGMGIVLRFTAFISNGLDRTLIGMWVGVSVVAVYAIQLSIILPAVGLMGSIVVFFFPMTSELNSTGKVEELKSIFKRITRFSAAGALLVFILLLLYGNIFLKLWVGDSIANQSQYLLPLLVLSGGVGFLAVGLANLVVVGMGKVRAFSIYLIVRAVVLAVGLVIFIRAVGLIGVGLAFLLTNLVEIGFYVFMLKKYLKIPFYELFQYAYKYPCIIAIVMCTVGLLVRPYITTWFHLIAVVSLLSISYISASFIVGVFGETEKKVVFHFGNVLLKSFKQ